MPTKDATGTIFSIGDQEFPLYFSEWIKHRRQELDLTQDQLAKVTSCSVFAIRKIEMGERRPSRQLAELLAKSLEIPTENQATFIKVARGELSVDCLRSIVSRRTSLPAEASISIPGNLPRALTPFIGREPELNALGELLQDPQCSLLTIVGPGGIGKTRLGIEAAQRSNDLFPDGIWFIPLVSLTSPAQILSAIAEVFQFKFQDPVNPQAQFLRYLRTKKALLVLDNAEHLLDGVGVFAEILKDCQQIKLLVTSRERLNLLSEWVFEIQGLPVPPNDQVEQFDSYSSVALFLECARRVRSGFKIQKDERRPVLTICQTMEGMPLGIELSAAWVGLLPCEEIAREIKQNFDFLSASMRDLPERHRSLRATLDHSWKLLNDEERLILSRLSVFHGSFTREAAQVICGASLAVLSSLRDKTLLSRTDQEHFALHEMIRQYAGQKLAEHLDENEQVNDRHAVYYVQCLASWEKALQSSRQLETLNEMAKVIDNLSQAWQYMISHCRPGIGKIDQLRWDMLHSALFSISLFYETRCRSLEGIALFKDSVEYLKTVQAEFEGTEDSSRFTSILGHITAYLGLHYRYVFQYEKSLVHLKEAVKLLEDSHSWVEKAQAQYMLTTIYVDNGQLQEAVDLLQQSREVFRGEGVVWWYAVTTVVLANQYISLWKHQESEALFLEAFDLVEPGDFYIELSLRAGFAFLLGLQKDFTRAEQMLQECLQLSYLYGNFRDTALTLFSMCRVMLWAQQVDQAEEYIQKSINLLTEFGETRELAWYRLYLGKCFAARLDHRAAREQFRKVIEEGQELGKVHLVYYGLLDIAKTYLAEGKTEKALEISLALCHCPIEYEGIQNLNDQLFEELQTVLPKEIVEAVRKQVDEKITPDQTGAVALAYAFEQITG